ncbi:MAG: hypothetical protein IJV02_03950, partial [Candidatus Methanomethylophilaceae archaeon]|nr:hypothetical protein [Candidatus Methanomethylophilaceae archaeon]
MEIIEVPIAADVYEIAIGQNDLLRFQIIYAILALHKGRIARAEIKVQVLEILRTKIRFIRPDNLSAGCLGRCNCSKLFFDEAEI